MIEEYVIAANKERTDVQLTRAVDFCGELALDSDRVPLEVIARFKTDCWFKAGQIKNDILGFGDYESMDIEDDVKPYYWPLERYELLLKIQCDYLTDERFIKNARDMRTELIRDYDGFNWEWEQDSEC